MLIRDLIEHYNKLIDENNDPARDPKPLRDYMDKWDGEKFIESMRLDKSKSVLEIGIGTDGLVDCLNLLPKETFTLVFDQDRCVRRRTDSDGEQAGRTL